ncbi:hypothetical protein MYVA_3861 [Mycolicibacterium vaccae 95051]|nr:hypothetical protein MYVA_3861 [Mycolicibacterium vaccae 95051]
MTDAAAAHTWAMTAGGTPTRATEYLRYDEEMAAWPPPRTR